MRTTLIVLFGALCCSLPLIAQRSNSEKLENSRCHVFVDLEYIWTLEMVEAGRSSTPILNIITFGEEELPLKPEQIVLRNQRNRRATVEKFSIDTGVDGDPYVTNYLMVLGGSFLGMDLKGSFSDHAEPKEVIIQLGDDEFRLQPIDCLDYEALAQQINQINFNSPNVEEDFKVLNISPMGIRQPKKKGRRP